MCSQLFIDIEQAIQRSQLLTGKRKFKYLRRPIGKPRKTKPKFKIKKNIMTLICNLWNKYLLKVGIL
jgi:hypothetical protein